MPRTVEVTLFKFDELSDRAKEKAREWYRRTALDYEWWDSVYDDAVEVAGIIGVEFDRGASTGNSPAIGFSGFSSQGDGACFTGRYNYARNAHRKIRKYAPTDSTLHKIADDLHALQKANRYRLMARIYKISSHYSHEHTVAADVSDRITGNNVEIDTEKTLMDIMRNFMRWIYRALESEYEHLMSDESVDGNIQANDYEFNEDGTRARG